MSRRPRLTKASATALLVVLFAVLTALAWYGRGQRGTWAQLQSELLCAFLFLLALLFVSLPAVVALQPKLRANWLRTVRYVPVGLAAGVAAWFYRRQSTADLTRTLAIAGGVMVAVGIAALAGYLRNHRAIR